MRRERIPDRYQPPARDSLRAIVAAQHLLLNTSRDPASFDVAGFARMQSLSEAKARELIGAEQARRGRLL